jgi:hypothetical protein
LTPLNSCFHKPNVFKFEGQYYEFIADPDYVDPCYTHPFRIILGEDDYDYVEDKFLIERLTKFYFFHRLSGEKDV